MKRGCVILKPREGVIYRFSRDFFYPWIEHFVRVESHPNAVRFKQEKNMARAVTVIKMVGDSLDPRWDWESRVVSVG